MEESSDNDKSRKGKKLAYAMLVFSIIHFIIYYTFFSGILSGYFYSNWSTLGKMLVASPQAIIMILISFFCFLCRFKFSKKALKIWFFFLVTGSSWTFLFLTNIS